MTNQNQTKIQHNAKKGDSLYKIAKYYNTTINKILNDNPQINPKRLKIGDIININTNKKSSVPAVNYINADYDNNENDTFNKKMLLINEIRHLWNRHTERNHLYIIAEINNLGDTRIIQNSLFQNINDILDLLTNYYSEEELFEVITLLNEHLQIEVQLIDALKEKSEDVKELYELWILNTDELARELHLLNNNYDEDEIKNILYKYLELTLLEIHIRIDKNYRDLIKIYDEIMSSNNKLADIMSEGIIKQFPEKF